MTAYRLPSLFRQPLFWAYLFFSLFVRFYNFQRSLYFIYDQGRDALVLQKIAHGHLVLVGPTTGLGGLFLGPLWFYVCLPGFLVGGGNPYVTSLWLISISSLALPMFWYLAHQLFANKWYAFLCAILLAIVPGSITASTFVWNPLMSVPLMTGALLCIWKGRDSLKWFATGFFLLALTLQSEFAYAIFFLPVLFACIPWIRKHFAWQDFSVAAAVVAITLVPQFVFDLRNHFIMTTSLLHSLGDTSQSIPWSQLFDQRPHQLADVTSELLFGPGSASSISTLTILCLMLMAFFGFLKTDREKDSNMFLWKLTALFAIIPYPFFMLWRGNHGYFFSYYVTAHFVFLVPMVVFGIQQVVLLTKRKSKTRYLAYAASCLVIVYFCLAAFHHWQGTILNPENNAGLAKMEAAINKVYDWQQEDNVSQATIRTYTANIYTEQYDYLYQWIAQQRHVTAPRTVSSPTDKIWYIIIESRDTVPKIFFDPWYTEATKGGTLVRQEKIGVLTLETWKKS